MSGGQIPVKIDDVEFDLGNVGDWVLAHPYLVAIAVLVAYIFWISRKDGLIGAFLAYRIKRKQLDAKTAEDRLTLTKLIANLSKPKLPAPRQPAPPRRRPRKAKK